MPEPTINPKTNPDEVVGSFQFWRKDDGTDQPVDKGDPNKGNVIGWGGTHAVLMEQQTHADGTIWITIKDDKGDWSEPQYSGEIDKGQAALWKMYNSPGTGSAQWSIRTGPDGKTYRVNEVTGEVQPVDEFNTPETLDYNKKMADAQLANQQRLASGVSSAAPRQDLPGEYEGRMLENKLKSLQIQKADQGLMNQYTLARQQAFDEIANLQQAQISGQISQADADKQMAGIRANLDATLKGTTPFQMEKQRQDLANSYLNNRVSAGTGMAQSLLSGIGGGYNRILKSSNPPTNFNPFTMAKTFVDEMGGGLDTSKLAAAILQGAMGGNNGGF